MTTWARLILVRPWLVAVMAVVVVLLSGLWGLGVLDRLNLAGYTDPDSESAQVDNLIASDLGRQTPDVVAIYTAPAGRSLEDIRPQVLDRLKAVSSDVLARPIESYWTASGPIRQALVSTDRTKALAVLSLRGGDGDRLKAYMKLTRELTVPGIRTQFTGISAVTDAYNAESKRDVMLAESVAVPLTLLLVLVIFGGFVAATVPVVVGGLTIFGSLGALRLISIYTDVSAFALDVASVLGLGLAIDYGLFLVSRFREELNDGHSPVVAAQRTVRTAGRAVAFSTLLMTCAFAGVLAAPVAALRSVGFGAIAAVDIAALISLTAVPAVLAILGHRINALSVGRGAQRLNEARTARFWSAVADRVMKRPIIAAAVVVGVLLVLAGPLFGVKPGQVDISGLSTGSPVRIAQSTLTSEFPNATNGATLMVRGENGAPPSQEAVSQVMSATRRADGVRFVLVQSKAKDFVLLHVVLSKPDFTMAARNTVKSLRHISGPPGPIVLVGGENASGADSDIAIVGGIPLMLAVMLGATLLIMFMAFRSIVLPFKAVAMAMFSLAATIGILLWVFQDGHGAELFGADAGPLPLPSLIVVIGAVFGLSTDYELFLMSRMMEAHEHGATTEEAVRVGVSQTARVITAAAALMIIVTAALGSSSVSMIKIIGLGMALAIFIDATIVRMLLVPALVKLMGRANWWLPRLPWTRRVSAAVHPIESKTPPLQFTAKSA
ncbi:MMPL family transporter [Mycobacterium sp. Aquia_213]|uniref:MMPL family transporter n=1 Tax=Mycobacterium sp. Aquia_213 TaxID=2991728 RepID=UPI002271FEDD|nr:MMPL family transporter [Mycobacterium sp. Aquia_213]WAC90178.1 MMPL family transporter [Mycobacterium sp. Aquia_213]